MANDLWNRTWVVVLLTAHDDNNTKIDVYHMGLGVGEEWDKVYDFFDRNWALILNRLDQSFANVN